MKLLRVGEPGVERPAALIENRDGSHDLVDLSTLVDDITPDDLDPHALGELERTVEVSNLPRLDPALRIGPPISRIGKVVCVGLNYREHAAEAGQAVPSEPILFLKSPDTVIGPDDDVRIPRGSAAADYEVELAIVIGRTARYLDSSDDPFDYIAGYAISNDVSEREFQLHRGGQWDKGKNCETFNPFGPWLVTTTEVPDPQNLSLQCSISGELRQNSNTADMIFSIPELVRYISQFMALYPGDVINTGTPQGVGSGFTPARYLRPGDIAELSIAGLGTQRQQLVDWQGVHK